MVKLNQPIIKISELEQVGYVVRDAEKSAESMWKHFGIGPWNIVTIPADFTEKMTYHGKPARFGFKAAVTQKKVGGFEIELIEPLEGDSTYRDFLRDHGDGIHHLGWHKVNSLDAYNKTARALEQAGFACLMSGQSRGVAFGYFDTTRVLSTILEVLWIDATIATPPPVIRVIP